MTFSCTYLLNSGFFTDKAKKNKSETIIGSKYLSDYDFLFPINQDKQIDFSNDIWIKPIEFIEKRRIKMIDYLKNKYDIVFKTNNEE